MKYIEISWNGNLGAIIIFRQTQMLTAWWLQPTFFVSIGIWRWSKDSIVDGLNVIEPTNQWRIICYFMLLLGFDWCAGNQRLRIPRMLPLCHSISWHVSRDDRVPVSSVSTLGELWCVLARFICGLRRAFSATQAWSLDPEAESVEHDFANFGSIRGRIGQVLLCVRPDVQPAMTCEWGRPKFNRTSVVFGSAVPFI
jgi:hypothetical protein